MCHRCVNNLLDDIHNSLYLSMLYVVFRKCEILFPL
jgi:hypothetical protein